MIDITYTAVSVFGSFQTSVSNKVDHASTLKNFSESLLYSVPVSRASNTSLPGVLLMNRLMGEFSGICEPVWHSV